MGKLLVHPATIAARQAQVSFRRRPVKVLSRVVDYLVYCTAELLLLEPAYLEDLLL